MSMSNKIRKIKTFMGKFYVKAIGSGREITIEGKLGSEKNPLKREGKIGIHQSICNDCDKIYIGQTKRLITTNLKNTCHAHYLRTFSNNGQR